MLISIFGWLWIIAGTIFMLKPQMMRNRLQKKGMKKLRKYFFLLSIILGGLLISAGWHYEGILAKLIVVVGIIAIIKGLILIKAKAADKMVGVASGPVPYAL